MTARMLLLAVVLTSGDAWGQSVITAGRSIAVLELDALGMEAEPVARLDTLFRKELERLSGKPLPSRARVARILRGSTRLRKCSREDRCIAQIGRRLGVDVVVSGAVAALGDTYTINIKAVDSATGKQLGKRIDSEPVRGKPDELIEAVRVAAYALLAEDKLHGSLRVICDHKGAGVALDGKKIGVTPLARIDGLSLGPHELEVSASGYKPYRQKVQVRFQKTTRIVAALAQRAVLPVVVVRKRPSPKRWYNSTWFYVGAGVAAAGIGAYVGYRLVHEDVIDCSAAGAGC